LLNNVPDATIALLLNSLMTEHNMQKVLALVALIGVVLVGCGSKSSPSKIPFSSISTQGDAAHGAQLFTQGVGTVPACSTCHSMDESQRVGPGLAVIKQNAATRVQGESAQEYIYHSIVEPYRYVVTGYSNVMYPDYDNVLTAQDISDLIAFLLN
jgi:cytochrome c553